MIYQVPVMAIHNLPQPEILTLQKVSFNFETCCYNSKKRSKAVEEQLRRTNSLNLCATATKMT